MVMIRCMCRSSDKSNFRGRSGIRFRGRIDLVVWI